MDSRPSRSSSPRVRSCVRRVLTSPEKHLSRFLVKKEGAPVSGCFSFCFGEEEFGSEGPRPPPHPLTDETIHRPVVLRGCPVFRYADSAQSGVSNRKATVQSPERLLRGPGLRPHVPGREEPDALLRQLPAVGPVVLAVAFGAHQA